jgi:type III secretory pathway component EscS
MAYLLFVYLTVISILLVIKDSPDTLAVIVGVIVGAITTIMSVKNLTTKRGGENE